MKPRIAAAWLPSLALVGALAGALCAPIAHAQTPAQPQAPAAPVAAPAAQGPLAIESVSSSIQGGVEVVRIDFSQPLAALPRGFTIQSPARIALDVPGGSGGRSRFGNMILSRHPVAQVLRYTLPWEAAATRNMPRLLLEAVIETPKGPVRVMTTHLE